MGAFDDLIPTATPSGGAFDDLIPSPTPSGTPEDGGNGFLAKVNAALRKPSPEVLQAPEAAVRELVGSMTPHDLPSYFESLFPPAAMAHQAVNLGEGLAQGDVSGVPLVGRIPEIMQADETPAGSKERYETAMKTMMDVAMLAGGGERAPLPEVPSETAIPPPIPSEYAPPPVPPPPIGTPLAPKPLLGPPGTTAGDMAAAQVQPQSPVSAEVPPPLIQPGDEPYAGVTPQVGPEGNPPGIANRYVEEQIYRGELPPEAMATGTGTTAIAAAQEARARLAEDPQAAFTAARRIRNGLARGGDTALLHAYNDQLAEGAAQARQAAIANPNDAGLQAAAENAEKSHIDFLQNVKPLAGGLVQRLMVGFQGAYPPDLSTYAGMYKEMTQLNDGRPVPREIRNNLYRRAAKAQKAAQAEKAAGDKLQQAMDKNLPKRPVPTKEQMSARMEEFKRRVAPCP